MATWTNLQDLTPDQQSVVLDVGQILLDIVGIFEPTPFADLTNTVISVMRSDHWGAAIRVAGVLPYIGDVAKLANLPKYAQTIEKAIALARVDQRLATVLRPLFSKIVSAIDAIPASMIPRAALVPLERLRSTIAVFLGGTRVMTKVDRLTDAMLTGLLGSTVNVGALPRRNARFIVEFLVRNNVIKEGDVLSKATINLFRGTDIHAVEAVSVLRLKAGERLWQYVDDGAAALAKNKQFLVSPTGTTREFMIGEWFVRPHGAVSPTKLGISAEKRSLEEVVLKENVEVLVSRSSATADSWTAGRIRQVSSPHGRDLPGKNAELVLGGGEQLYLPRAWAGRVRPVERANIR